MYFILDALNFYDVAYVHLVDPIEPTESNCNEQKSLAITSSLFRSIYQGTIILNCKDDLNLAQMAIANGNVDLISFDKLLV